MTASSGSEAVSNGRKYNSYSSGMCQQFVRGPCWEVGSLYGSAIEAWNGAAEKHPGDRTPPVGAPCYYRGGSYGHAVIYVGNGNVRSTDTPGTGQVGEKPLSYYETAWGYTYLGWTGDINGVDLPIGDNEDMPSANEIADAVWQRILMNQNSAPDGRVAGSTLSGIRNIVERIESNQADRPTAEEIAQAVWAYLLKNQVDAPQGRAAGPTMSHIYNQTRGD